MDREAANTLRNIKSTANRGGSDKRFTDDADANCLID
jgi:hypothetical protein